MKPSIPTNSTALGASGVLLTGNAEEFQHAFAAAYGGIEGLADNFI